MINTEILYGELRRYENIKDEIIQTSIKAARLSKSVVYSAIRRDFETAAKSLAELEAVVERLKA
ncbi:MAG: haloacid dehalogenase, partial [Pyrobaculum sp.]